MKYRVLVLVAFVIIWLFAFSALGRTVVNVPSAISKDARFRSISSESDRTRAAEHKPITESFVAHGGDGACAVISKGAMICALLGSRFSLHGLDMEGHMRTTLSEGGFRVIIGSKSMVFMLDGVAVTAREAVILVTKIENNWVVKAESFFVGGTLEISVLDAAPLEPESTSYVKKHALKKGQTVYIGKSRRLEPATQSHRTAIKDVAARLNEPELSGSLLSPLDVEDTTDLMLYKIDKDTTFEDIEIEEIEIEAGCVEICID